MKNLFIVDGASGAGKSDFVEYVEGYSTRASVVRKYTTRPKRDYEKKTWFLDLQFVSKPEFKTLPLDYEYTYSGEHYGFARRDLIEALLRSRNAFVIVRNAEITRQIIDEFAFINVVPVFVYTYPVQVRERLRSQHMSDEQVEFRSKPR